jgi:nucleoside-diphosphate-sugar epimerase
MTLVVGAAGNLGGRVTRMLLAQGQLVRILARSQSNYQPLVEAGAQVVLGDLKEPDSLVAACRAQRPSSRRRTQPRVGERTLCRRWTWRAIAT